MGLWWPGPWGPMSAVDPKSLAESPHQAAIAEKHEEVEEQPRRRRSAKSTSDE